MPSTTTSMWFRVQLVSHVPPIPFLVLVSVKDQEKERVKERVVAKVRIARL